MRRFRLLAVLLLASPLGAQTPARTLDGVLSRGDRIRISSPAIDYYVRGMFVSLDSTHLALVRAESFDDAANGYRIPLAAIGRVELSRGRRQYTWPGAGIGAAVLGVLSVSFRVDPATCNDRGSSAFCSRGEAVTGAAILGALVGGVLGHYMGGDRWKTVYLAPGGPSVPAGVGTQRNATFRPAGAR